MGQRVIFTRGISASGKSTYAQKLVDEQGFVRVEMDGIRATLGLPYTKENEKLALKIQDQVFLTALRSGKSVVVSNLHLHNAWPKRLITLAWESGFSPDYAIYDLTDVPLDVCIERNNQRADNHGVTEAIIKKQYGQLQSPKAGWTIKSITSTLPEIVPVKPVRGWKPRAVCLDIDGTIAEHVARGPYDMHLLHTDRPFMHIVDLIDMYITDGVSIILCSGREEKYREATEAWMGKNRIRFSYLFMRPTGDERRDSIIKLELHDKYIRDRFDVHCVYDDRDRVVNIWRALGYPCLQVAPGDF